VLSMEAEAWKVVAQERWNRRAEGARTEAVSREEGVRSGTTSHSD
jgi:hypothetical protein